MRFSITGGSDVAGSAERAPLRPALFDRLAVGVITVVNSPERANEVPVSGRSSAHEDDAKSREDPNRLHDWRDRAEIARVTAGETAPLVSPPYVVRQITGDKDRVLFPVGGPTSSDPDPRTLAGADGRRSTPSLLAVGVKSDGASLPSSVGTASERNVGVHESRQAVTYSPWAVRRSSNSLRSTYP